MAMKATTWKHIRRSPYQAFAAILTMFLAFLLGGLFFIVSISSVFILQYFESKPQLTVFFTDTATQKDIDGLKHTVEATGKVSTTKYISKEDALAIYKEQNKKDPLLLEMVTADILPASLEISAVNPGDLSDLEKLVQHADGVQEVVYQKDVVDALITWTHAIRWAGGVIAGLLAFDSFLIVMTVIGMKIATRREEVEILKLVGASPWYIRMPYIIEGSFYGFSGAFFAWMILTGILVWIRPYILTFLGVVPVISWLLSSVTSTQLLVASGGFLCGMVVIGVLLGVIGSMVSVGRYLKIS